MNSWEEAWKHIEKEAPNCPICGGNAKVISNRETTGHGESSRYAYVKCSSCEIRTKNFSGGYDEPDTSEYVISKAINEWGKLNQIK